MPLAISPYLTAPSISLMTAGSLGLRVSKSSTTRGRPPVMSLVLVVSRGIFASTSPACTSSPSLTIKWAREGMRYFLRTLPEESRTSSAATTLDVLEVHELDDAVVARFKRGAFGNAGGRSTDMEGTHGELRAGFANRLRGDDSDGFAQFDHAPGGEVAPIAQRANAAAGLRGGHGTNSHALNTRALHLVGQLFRCR